jgi:hypothetical protein
MEEEEEEEDSRGPTKYWVRPNNLSDSNSSGDI